MTKANNNTVYIHKQSSIVKRGLITVQPIQSYFDVDRSDDVEKLVVHDDDFIIL